MEESEKLSLEQMRAFLEASAEVRFRAQDRAELYGWANQTLRQQDYRRLPRASKGVVRRYVAKMTGLSRAQVTRLIGYYRQGGEVRPRAYRRHRFPQRYTRADIELLAAVDEAHETLSGPATQKILQRALHDFGDTRFARLARLSVAQLYRLRKSRTCRQRRVAYQPTRPTPVAIGERRRPEPHGRPGYLRVDTVHQGDLDGAKGLYHINAVDEVTQWQVVGATAQISEAFDQFYRQHFNPYLNFHRPCGVPEIRTDAKGKQRRVYRWYATPWEILRQLPDLARHLREEITQPDLERRARAESDTQAAAKMQEAKRKLFAGLRQKRIA